MSNLVYGIISAGTDSDLCKRVNEEIALGWEPIGGVAVVQQLCDATKFHDDNRCTLYDAGFEFKQAMIKRSA